jgi:hypothetical protein
LDVPPANLEISDVVGVLPCAKMGAATRRTALIKTMSGSARGSHFMWLFTRAGPSRQRHAEGL